MNTQPLPNTPHRPVVMVNGRPCTASGAVVLSGSAFRKPDLTRDDELLQAALLDPRTQREPSVLRRIAGAAWKWC